MEKSFSPKEAAPAPTAPSTGTSRRGFLTRSVAAGGAVVAGLAGAQSEAAPAPAESATPTPAHPGADDTDSTFFATAWVDESATLATDSDGDLWPNCWADDDNLYAANGDGRGFSAEHFKDTVVNRIEGTPATHISGQRLAAADDLGPIWGDETKYNRKPTGMVCVHGVLYLAMQDLRHGAHAFDDVPNASVTRSDDHGRTWHPTSEPMFTDHRFTTIFFLDFGRDSENAVPALGAHDGRYVYAYGMDWNWRESVTDTVPDPTCVYLARVPDDAVQDRSRWEFFTGSDHAGRPRWHADITRKAPVLTDATRRNMSLRDRPANQRAATVISQGGVIYNRPLKRYLYTSWSGTSFEFYEAPAPWGPWKRFLYHNFGAVPWYTRGDTEHTPKQGGYGTVVPTKYISDDGRQMWFNSNWWEGKAPDPQHNYMFCLRRLKVTPYRWQPPANRPDPTGNIARTGADVTPVQVCAHHGNRGYYNDGDRTRGEDSYDGTNKLVDFWGYTFSRAYRIDRLVYTTGTMADDGGWFSAYDGGLRVQVRQKFRWVDVDGLTVSPDYPYDAKAGSNTSYTLRFAPTWGDGVRIVGQPGGSAFYTAIAELEVYYDGH